MSVDVTKAVDGNFYRFEEDLQLSDELLSGMNAHFTSPCKVVGKFVVLDTSVYVEARLSTTIDYTCDKCLTPGSVDINADMSVSYRLEDAPIGEDDAPCDYVYSGYAVNLSEAVHQDILLSLPTRLLCTKTCKGLCSICGVNLNTNSCSCDSNNRDEQLELARNPFASLKNYNFNSGGANNGSTKA